MRNAEGSVLCHGDLSVLSFHATKVFNTFEGGAIVCPDSRTKTHIDRLKNFGFTDEVTVVAAGINGKMSEINSAFGLLQLRYIDNALERRAEIDRVYRECLADTPGIHCIESATKKTEGYNSNYSYFPILVSSEYELSRDQLYSKMKECNVYARRYFYPLISDFPMYRGLPSAARENLPVASAASNSVLCLPIYPAMEFEDQMRVIELIRGA